MAFFLASSLKDLRRRLRDPAALATWIGIPLVIGGLITLATGGKEGATPRAHVLVVDRDDSFLSGMLVQALSAGGDDSFVRAQKVSHEQGRARIDAGDGSALLVIPAGFADGVLLQEPVELELFTNPSQRILPGIIEEGLSMLTDGVFYLHLVLGDEIREVISDSSDEAAFAEEQVAALSVQIHHKIENLSAYLFPPVITLETVQIEEEDEEPAVNFGLLFLPGILFMSLLFMAQGMSSDLWHERMQQTLRRVVVSPSRTSTFLFGKVAAGAALMLLVSAVALTTGFLYFDLPIARLPLSAIWATLSGAFLLAAMLLLQLFSPSQRAGEILSMTIVFPLMMIGGSFFPFEAMPDWMARVGSFTPNGWALEQLKGIILDRTSAGEIARSFVLLTAATAASFALGTWRTRRFVRE